ncbi:hypothetical protein H3146_15910 [Streptomyces sp. OF3]|uniref:Uncharacterized protein n=1 Tax=Streptomyces alkaliterrae TaxID=2213162 RepID=A0A7W3ZND4_9ACTN|nr:hypothetical protein [Streptomyces alkaliterrae]MBB1254829.1 hypothetical protein [Streptomyces alkaliterrae]
MAEGTPPRPALHRTGTVPRLLHLHTLRGDRIVGMLSVHATSGDVWYHTWHGRFLQTLEQPSSIDSRSPRPAQGGDHES